MLPIVVNASLTTDFKYWDTDVKRGICYNNELYGLVNQFPTNQRLQAYDQGCHLADQGFELCITCSDFGYDLWVNLRCWSQFQALTTRQPRRDVFARLAA